MKNETLIKKLSFIFDLSEKMAYQIIFDDLTTYLLRANGMYYIGIPFNKRNINERFVGFNIKTEIINYNGSSVECLCIVANPESDPDKLMLIAEDFAKSQNRKQITNDPYDWIDKWRTIFGDSLSKKMIYDVVGELIALKECYKKDKSFLWEGPKGGTHDIVGEKSIVEVKTTAVKKNFTVGIHSAYQLSQEKETFLYFIRLEKKPYCQSINSLAKELVSLGVPEAELEELLSKQGYGKGARARDITYDLLSLYAYKLSKDTFPIFGLEDINNQFAPYKNITGYTLEIDLSSVEHIAIFEKE